MNKFLIILSLCLLTACASRPQTHYFTLGVFDNTRKTLDNTIDEPAPPAIKLPASTNLGIGPIKLPSMLNRPGIVTHKTGSAVQVASHNLWAGRLKEDFTLVVAELIAEHLGISEVVTEPWNTRFRPEFQLQMDVQHFSGQLGGKVRFKVSWVLSAAYGQEKLLSQTDDITLQSNGASYEAYVSTLNRLLAKFSEKSVKTVIAAQILKHSKNKPQS